MYTFDVSDVALGTTRLSQQYLRAELSKKIGRLIEGSSSVLPAVYPSTSHPFIDAISAAFRYHLPLALSPDDVWLCLTHAIGAHVDLNAEALRERFVHHQGKAKISVRRDGFLRGSPDNDWGGVFDEVAAGILAQSTDVARLLVADFSTTGPVERAVSNLALVAAMKSYFDSELSTLCGIPRITLLGQVQDWRRIRERIERFEELGLGEWLNALRPALDEFVSAAQADVDLDFWRSLYKWEDESGGSDVSGWVNVLFPYIQTFDSYVGRGPEIRSHPHPNVHATHSWRSASRLHEGPKEQEFGSGLVAAPLSWQYLSDTIEMDLLSGFVGVSQDPETLTLRPAIGWAVCEAQQLS